MNEPRRWRTPAFQGVASELTEHRLLEEAKSHVGKPYLGIAAWLESQGWKEMSDSQRLIIAVIMAAGVR